MLWQKSNKYEMVFSHFLLMMDMVILVLHNFRCCWSRIMYFLISVNSMFLNSQGEFLPACIMKNDIPRDKRKNNCEYIKNSLIKITLR